MEKKIRQKIELDAEGKAKLAKAFGVTVQNVSQALRFKRNSPTAFQIREAALKNGGRKWARSERTIPRRQAGCRCERYWTMRKTFRPPAR